LQRVANGRRSCGDRFIVPYYGSGSGTTGRSLDRPLGTITTLDRWAPVDGDRMRMLRADECRAAMDFPLTTGDPSSTALPCTYLGMPYARLWRATSSRR